MCWSAEVSLQSFLIGFTATIVAYQNGLSFPMTLFCLTIVCMQLIEYVVWSNLTDSEVVFRASLAAAFLLFLQPIASLLTLPMGQAVPFVLVYVAFAATGLLLKQDIPLRDQYTMYRGENGHLVWNWLQRDWKTGLSLTVYFLFLLVPLLVQKHYELLFLALSTLGLSLYSFYRSNTWGSMWCWIVNYIVVGISVKTFLV
jgi:hypothetical protein